MIPAITPIFDDTSCEEATFAHSIPGSILYNVGDATVSIAMPTFTTIWGETCAFTPTLTSTSHTTINSGADTIETYTNGNGHVGTHYMTLTLSPDNFNDYVADEVINFLVIISSEMCDAFVLTDSSNLLMSVATIYYDIGSGAYSNVLEDNKVLTDYTGTPSYDYTFTN